MGVTSHPNHPQIRPAYCRVVRSGRPTSDAVGGRQAAGVQTRPEISQGETATDQSTWSDRINPGEPAGSAQV